MIKNTKIKLLLFKFLCFFILINLKNISLSNEIFEIFAEKVEYQNESNTIIANGNAKAQNNLDKIILADQITYDKKNNIIKANGKAKYRDKNNEITAEEFKYDINNKIIDVKTNVILTDSKGNKFFFSELTFNQISQKGYAFNIKSTGTDSSYLEASEGEINNEKKIYSIKNSKYTTCKNIFNKKKEFCPAWSLNSSKLIHDKNNKKIIHKNTFLKIKNIPILYTPYLSHPDPTVERQSGFLTPTIKTISNLGRTIKTPYFIEISKDKDLTITPIFYFDENHIYNFSYRQALKDGKFQLETSYTNGYKRLNKVGRSKGSRNYFFAEYKGRKKNLFFNDSEINFKLQNVSQQNYIKVNKLNTELFKEDINTLENILRIQSYGSNKRIDIKSGAYKNLNIDDTSKYTYFFPDGIFSYNSNKNKYFNLNFNSYFQGKKFEKTQKQGKIKNNLLITSKQINNKNLGVGSILKFSLFNKNIYNDDVTGLKDNLNINNNFSIAIDNQWPLAKINKNSYQTLIPRVFIKYTTGTMQNSKDQNKILEYSDIFSMNRTNDTDTLETGASAGYGIEYNINKSSENSLSPLYSSKFGFGQVIRKEREELMPSKSSLNNKSSDFAGFLNFNFYGNKIDFEEIQKKELGFIKNFEQNKLSFNYKFNLDNNVSRLNRNNLSFSAVYNKILTNIIFDEKSDHIGNERYQTINVQKLFANNYNFKIENKKNLKTNSSEYNRISLSYETDCIITSLAYSKDFYSDKDLQNSKTLIFGITFKPFADSLGPDLTSFLE